MNYTDIIDYALIACASLIALTLHECAHGYVAHLLGDDTAKNSGRLTLNPIKHIDIFGLLALIVVHIGWAKPVPINPYNFRSRKSGTILVSLAGPFTNFMLALLAGLFFKLTAAGGGYIRFFFLYCIVINVGFAMFNLLPFPPLDGSKIAAALLPIKLENYFYKYQQYLVIIVLILYMLGFVSKIINPVINFVLEWILNLYGYTLK
jgi:Zn-dependent protease